MRAFVRYVVMCRTTGGVTGTRESVVRSSGQVIYHGSYSEASHESMRLMLKNQRDYHGPAIMQYWVASEDEAALVLRELGEDL